MIRVLTFQTGNYAQHGSNTEALVCVVCVVMTHAQIFGHILASANH
jgi:hypothetical protein